MYEVYEALLRGENFEANARNWMDANLPNPFESNTEAHKLYFKAHQYCLRWRRGGIDCRSGKKYMFETIHKLMDLNMPNPYIKGKEVETKVELIEEPLPEIEKETIEITSDELKEDINYLMANMVNAHLRDDETSYEMYVTHLMDIVNDNPFLIGTNEYELFSQMLATYRRNPPNKRKTFVVGKQLCDLINNTELYPEKIEKPKQTVLGVLPDEEKKSWRQFLFPWRKEGEQDDSSRAD